LPATRLSQSPVWTALKRNYAVAGGELWDSGNLPFYITSNAALAHRYCRVLLAWLRDLGRLHEGNLTVVEIGCGTGRFTFQMLRGLEEISLAPALEGIHWSYVATDISDGRLNSLTKKTPLQPYFESKRLTTARYDVLSSEGLKPRPKAGAVAVICNYVLDSLPADCFLVQNGNLYESCIALDAQEVESITAGRCEFSHREIDLPYYADDRLDGLLEFCRAERPSRSVVFPSGAVAAMRNIRQLSNAPVLVLVADKVADSASSGTGLTAPEIEIHGDSHFSLPVDFELLQRFISAEGGEMLTSQHGREVIAFAACLFNRNTASSAETRLAFQDHFDRASPVAAYYLTSRLQSHAELLSIHDYLAWLATLHWDPQTLLPIFSFFAAKVASVPHELRPELVDALQKIADRSYPVPGEQVGTLFLTGSALLLMGEAERARSHLRRSIAEEGPAPAALFQSGRAEFLLGNSEQGLSLARQALQKDPTLGGLLARLGVLRGGESETRLIVEQMQWEAGIRHLGRRP
jgi:hypothetical protein